MKRQRGYTLIELLKVIVLILFSASVLYGVVLSLIAFTKFALS